MSKTLFLTGWGLSNYVASIAIAHKAIPDADFMPLSKKACAQYLLDIANDQKVYKHIYILGITFFHNIDTLHHALKMLYKKGIKITYFSIYSFPENHLLYNSEYFEFVYQKESNLEDLVAQYFNINANRIITLSTGKTYQPYLQASAYAHRMFENLLPYKRMIHHMSEEHLPKMWTDSDITLIEHYQRYGHRELCGKSQMIHLLKKRIQLIASTDARVIILGESGTGKETIALHLFQQSKRNKEPFITFNCASVNEQLLESTILGYEKGAFTGATERKAGLFERANGGTLFLDEIGELPLNIQAVLLRILEEGRFSRIGSTEEICVDVRVICATNRPLIERVRDNLFRADLFFRLNTFTIHAPALREHLEDLHEIVNNMWFERTKTHFPESTIPILSQYPWPGNVRELYHFLEQVLLFGLSEIPSLLELHIENMRPLFCHISNKTAHKNTPTLLKDVIKKHVKTVFEETQENHTQASKKLGISKNTLKKYLDKNVSKT